MTTDRIQLSVIVLFYHGERWIQDCISSIKNQSLPGSRYEIIMVDNGGSTPTVAKYKGQTNLKVLEFSENYGFAGGNNKALPHAEGELILLLNQDVSVHYDCLQELLSAFKQYPRAGVISANMLMVSSEKDIDHYKSTRKPTGLYELTRFGYASYVTKATQSNVIPVDFVSGNAMCFRKGVLSDVGKYLFDDRLVSYAEDLDLSIRLKNTKWEMYVCPKAVIYHFRDDAFSGKPLHKIKKLFHISSNRLIVYYNNLGPIGFLKRLPSLLIGIPLKVSRLDEEVRFNFQRFTIALLFLPFIFIYFLKRIPDKFK